MASRHYYRPIDPGYGSFGGAIGRGLVGAGEAYTGMQQQKRDNRYRQAALEQDSQRAAQLDAYRQRMLDLRQQREDRLAGEEAYDPYSDMSRGYFPKDVAPSVAEAYGLELSVPAGPDRVYFPGYTGAVRGPSRGEVSDQRAAALDNFVTENVIPGIDLAEYARDPNVVLGVVEGLDSIPEGSTVADVVSRTHSVLRSPRQGEEDDVNAITAAFTEDLVEEYPRIFDSKEDIVEELILNSEGDPNELEGPLAEILRFSRRTGMTPQEATNWVMYHAGVYPTPNPPDRANPRQR